MSERAELNPDSPLKSLEKDRLGYADFTEQLATTIINRTPSNGYTIGINGPWGSGKSTILYFVEEHLDEFDSPPVVVRFNPWWFSGQADLIEKFLSQLGTALGSEDHFSELRPQLTKLSSALSEIPFGTFTGIPAERGFAAAATLLQQEGESIGDLKQEIDEELEAIDEKIIVIIDDIDRLSPEEITQMFQIIKSIADFPNVVYILAFDRSVVVDSLKTGGNINNADQYLEKIIQLPFKYRRIKMGH